VQGTYININTYTDYLTVDRNECDIIGLYRPANFKAYILCSGKSKIAKGKIETLYLH
jgi:hypothetical protein